MYLYKLTLENFCPGDQHIRRTLVRVERLHRRQIFLFFFVKKKVLRLVTYTQQMYWGTGTDI